MAIEVLITLAFPDALAAPLRQVSKRLQITLQPARKIEDIAPDVWGRTEVLYTDLLLPAPDMVPALKWIQFHYAGIDFAVDAPLLHQPGLAVTTLSGASASQVAEYAVMMLLALGHHFPELVANQARAEWPRERWERFLPRELRGSTVGIVGYGSIGRQVARLLQPFGVRLLAAKRDAMQPWDDGYIMDGTGDLQGDFFTRLYPIQALRSMFKECDFVVVTLPLTPQTRGLIGAADLAALKATAYIVDLGRGGVIDQSALVKALQEQKIAGAALDVFSEEPLSPNHPLWHMPNVLATPHISGISNAYNERALALFAENLRRYAAGEPLYNRFDLERGY